MDLSRFAGGSPARRRNHTCVLLRTNVLGDHVEGGAPGGSLAPGSRAVLQVVEVDSDKAAAAMGGEQAEAIKGGALGKVALLQGERDRGVTQRRRHSAFAAVAGRV